MDNLAAIITAAAGLSSIITLLINRAFNRRRENIDTTLDASQRVTEHIYTSLVAPLERRAADLETRCDTLEQRIAQKDAELDEKERAILELVGEIRRLTDIQNVLLEGIKRLLKQIAATGQTPAWLPPDVTPPPQNRLLELLK